MDEHHSRRGDGRFAACAPKDAQRVMTARVQKERPLRVACTAISLYVPPGSGGHLVWCNRRRAHERLPELLNLVCAVDHRLNSFTPFCDDQHKSPPATKKGREPAPLPATQKVPHFPAEPGTMFGSLDVGSGQSQIKPQLRLSFPGRGRSDYPAASSFCYGAS
jgi:hypothetical protein